VSLATTPALDALSAYCPSAALLWSSAVDASFAVRRLWSQRERLQAAHIRLLRDCFHSLFPLQVAVLPFDAQQPPVVLPFVRVMPSQHLQLRHPTPMPATCSPIDAVGSPTCQRTAPSLVVLSPP